LKAAILASFAGQFANDRIENVFAEKRVRTEDHDDRRDAPLSTRSP
jgi:hypothetical protein